MSEIQPSENQSVEQAVLSRYPRLTRFAQQAISQAAALIPEPKILLPETLLFALLQQSNGDSLRLVQAAEAPIGQMAHQLYQYWSDPAIAAKLRTTADAANPLPAATQQVLLLAQNEADGERSPFISTRHLLMALRQSDSFAGKVLSDAQIALDYLRANPQTRDGAINTKALQPNDLFAVSPIFWLLVSLTVAAGWFAYLFTGEFIARVCVFLFVIGGWVISVALHEYGHALAAYFGGDKSVVRQGYLSLNPLKYTHSVTSIIFPIIIIIAGGIGLPGGAVYINIGRISSRWWRMLVSAAGPIASAICALFLWLPFYLAFDDQWKAQHVELWSGWALLLYFTVTAIFFNLLPIPGLDGYGIIAPLLPVSVQRAVSSASRYTFLIIMLIFFNDNPLRDGFGRAMFWLWNLLGVTNDWIGVGLYFFRFWQS